MNHLKTLKHQHIIPKMFLVFLFFISCNEDKPIKYVENIYIYDEIPHKKLSLDVRITERVDKTEIENIAYALFRKYNGQNYENFFIVYYLPRMELGNGGYASSHFNPSLDVEIYGLTSSMINSIKQSFQNEEFWIDDYSQLMVNIRKSDNNYKLFQVANDLDSGSRPLKLETSQNGDSIYLDLNSPNKTYYKINMFRNLEIWDDKGLIYTIYKTP